MNDHGKYQIINQKIIVRPSRTIKAQKIFSFIKERYPLREIKITIK
jgi:hypothetical protein